MTAQLGATARVRPIAICVIRRNGRMLLGEAYDAVKRQWYYRPLGGSIEFGELGAETVARELQEEIGADVCDLRYLGTLENLFTCDGKPGHEIVLVFEGGFLDEEFYSRDRIECREADGSSEAFKAVWVPADQLDAGPTPLYPDGLRELLRKTDSRPSGVECERDVDGRVAER